jgi:hypothetical protein
MSLDDLVARAQPLDTAGLPVLRLERDEDLPGLVAWFGEDRARDACHLVVRGEDAGRLERTDVWAMLADRSMGFGDSARTILPGTSPAWRTLELFCPEAGCPESPVYAMSFDPARPPHCRVHPTRELAPG